jgi:hypothetical protein
MADRLTVNAGGRRFETSTTTLISCGAGYFDALLGETGQKLRGRKRARAPEVTGAVDDDDAPGAPREIFVDRSPDLFEDVLQFARANRLSAATRKDDERLEDLKTEAEFFCCDRLAAACDEALEALERARPTARCLTFHVKPYFTRNDEGDITTFHQNVVVVDVPKGHVLYIVSAQPQPEGDSALTYTLVATNNLNDADGLVSIVQGRRVTSQYDSRPGAGFTMAGGATEKVYLCAYAADFWVVAWVGHPSKIPGLGAPRD